MKFYYLYRFKLKLGNINTNKLNPTFDRCFQINNMYHYSGTEEPRKDWEND